MSLVNICISNKNNLYSAAVLPTTPCKNSNALGLATPILRPILVELPLVEVGSSNNFSCLYGVVSPDTSPISGVPYTLVILVKLPISKLVTPAFIVSKSLAFFKSLNVNAVFSIS